MNSVDETENELYDIIKNGINNDMSDDDVSRVIKYVMKSLPSYNKMKGTSSATEMILKMFSLSCKIINLWHSTKGDPYSGDFQEEPAIESFTEMYLTSRFNVEVYYSNLSFTEFTKNVALFVKLIESVKPVTRILNQISYIVDELKEYNFYDCKQILENALESTTIIFTDSDYGMVSPFRRIDNGFYVPSTDEDGNSAYTMLLNLVNAPYKSFSLTVSNVLTASNLYIEVDNEQKTLADIIAKCERTKYSSYASNLSTYLSGSYSIDIASGMNDDTLNYDATESGIVLKIIKDSGVSTSIRNASVVSSIISTLTRILKDVYNTNNVIVRCTGTENPTTVELSINHAKNTYSFGDV